MLRYCCVVINQLGKRKRELSSLCRAASMHKYTHYHIDIHRDRDMIHMSAYGNQTKKKILGFALYTRFFLIGFTRGINISDDGCVCVLLFYSHLKILSSRYVLFVVAVRRCAHDSLAVCASLHVFFSSRFIVKFYALDNGVKSNVCRVFVTCFFFFGYWWAQRWTWARFGQCDIYTGCLAMPNKLISFFMENSEVFFYMLNKFLFVQPIQLQIKMRHSIWMEKFPRFWGGKFYILKHQKKKSAKNLEEVQRTTWTPGKRMVKYLNQDSEGACMNVLRLI